jgi:acyl-CoA thioester hydrolase
LTPFVDTTLRVRYSETDRMGIVYHAHYIVWFEIGRTEYCRAAGMPYRAMEDAGLLILVTSVACTYRRSARYDDPVVVRSRMTELSARGCAFGYEVAGPGGSRLADGSSRHVFADSAGRLRRAPEEILRPLWRFRAAGSDEPERRFST